MRQKHSKRWMVLFMAAVMLSIIACSLIPGDENQATPEEQAPPGEAMTPTPTLALIGSDPDTPATNSCQGLSGTVEVLVLAGPAEAVGLEPYAVGNIPFAVTTSDAPYLISGEGPIVYEDMLVEDWGTYTVTMDLDISIEGECVPSEESAALQLALTMAGEQLVVVDAEGFYGEYPWEGTHTLDVVFPLEEGAYFKGEGFAFSLHPNMTP